MQNSQDDLTTVILAAGKGTRMQSDLAKVLHPLNNRPMIHYVVETALAIGSNRIIVVVGHQADQVKKALKNYSVQFVEQEQQLGTGHAVMQAVPGIEDHCDNLLVLAGDTPLIQADTLDILVSDRRRTDAAVSILTAKMKDPTGLGRIVRIDGQIVRIVEEKDASEDERRINEINTSTYCFNTPLLISALREIKDDNKQQEYYLTDTIGILRDQGRKISGIVSDHAEETMGINTRAQLTEAEAYQNARKQG